MKKIFDELLEIPLIYKIYTFRPWKKKDLKLTYRPEDLNSEYYGRVKDLGLQELEHQIGRLNNFKKIIKSCASLDGDFVEFGSWRGFSLLWTAFFMERNAILQRKLIGLDGFIGLPYTDGLFRIGKFANTSKRECWDNIQKSDEIYPETKKNIFIGKFLYKEKESILKYFKRLRIQKLCFVHIDCDISQSAREIFDILESGNLLADQSYLLFDDYGIEPKLREVVEDFLEKLQSQWNIEIHSETKLTRNYFLSKKKV